MNRREFGSSIVLCALFAMSGCLGSDAREASQSGTTTTRTTQTTTSSTESQTVRVTKRVEAGQTGLIRVVQVRDGGEISIELTCPGGTTKSTTGQLSDQEWSQFEQLVRNTELATLQSTYECDSQCPSDIPLVQLTIAVDDRVAEIQIEAGAEQPESLAMIQSQLTTFTDELDTPTCTSDE